MRFARITCLECETSVSDWSKIESRKGVRINVRKHVREDVRK